MKLTLATFLFVLSLLVVATAVPQRVEPEELQMPLDVAGIDLDGVDTVAVAGSSVNVVFDDDVAAAATWNSDGDCDVQSKREAHTLIVTTSGDCFRDVELTLPATVTRINAESLDIHAVTPIDSLAVRVRHHLNWTGDARRLQIVEDPGEDRDCPDDASEFCMTEIRISDARIDELEISTHDGSIVLESARTIAHATLRLGPQAGFSLGQVRSLANIEVIPLDAAGEPLPALAEPAADDAAQIAPAPTDHD